MPSIDSFDERQTLLELSQGSETAFEKIYKFYSARIYFKIKRLLKSEVIANDVLQDVFLTIWKNRKKLNLEKSFWSYLFCIATNKCYDYFRTIKRNKRLLREINLLSNNSNITEQDVNMEQDYEKLHDVIELLPPKRKLVFELCKIEGKTYEQISFQLGVSLSTISDHIVKANHFIKDHIVNESNYVIV